VRIRLAILDDNPFVELPDGTVHPRAATFHRFAEAVVAAGPFERADYLVPVTTSDATTDPATPAVDPDRLRVVPTSPFDGIAGYLRSSPRLARRNWPVIRDTVAGSDLVWIKAPASNATLAAIAARRAGRPFFTWVAGSAQAVARGQTRALPTRILAVVVGALYDGVTSVLERSGPALRLDDTYFTSLVTAAEIAITRDDPGRDTNGHGLRLAWAGRMVADKALDDLLAAVAVVRRSGLRVTLNLLGDGPARPGLEAQAASLGLGGAVRWHGHVAERDAYLSILRAADLFVLPSRAEGVPKVILDAMAAGLPTIASRVGGVPRLLGGGRRGRLVEPNDVDGLVRAIQELARDQRRRADLRAAGLAFAAEHTMEAQAGRLVAWLRLTFPRLEWGGAEGGGG
jgi:glycosyltransferase involved in cell wall biosynthesis